MDDLGNRMSVEDRSERDILYAADIVNAYESVGAVGWWKMNESAGTTAADGSGNAQDGTLNNFGAFPWVAGQTGYGNALEFDGVDDYVSIPSDTEFVFPDEYTYAVWIKPDNVTTSYQPILNRTTSSIWQMGFWLSNSQLRAYTHYSGDDAAATSVSGVIAAGQWQHVAVVHKGGKNHLYVNGQEVSYVTQTQATGTKTTYPAYGFVMGMGLESVQRYFNGCLDDVLVFNTALSAHAIEALYLDAAGTGEKYYAHDAAGNLIRDDRGYRYSYDYENRLSKVEKPDGAGDWQTVATFEYDALGRRIRKVDVVASVTTLYYYDADWRCLEERDGSDVLQRSFIYGNYIDEVLVMSIPGSPPTDYYCLHDHLYSPAALLAVNGTVVERYEYDAYGTVHVLDASWNSRSASAYGNPYTFTGRRLDWLDNACLKIMYYRHRVYTPDTGRFVQRDPLGVNPHAKQGDSFLGGIPRYFDGLNGYEYALSGPLRGADPLGLFLVIVAPEPIVDPPSVTWPSQDDPCDDTPCGSQKDIDRAYEHCRDGCNVDAAHCAGRALIVCAFTPWPQKCRGAYLMACARDTSICYGFCRDMRDWCEGGGHGKKPDLPWKYDPWYWKVPKEEIRGM